MFKYVIALVAVACVASALSEAEYKAQFGEWQSKFNKTYTSQSEREVRFQIFCDNVDKINRHNADETQTFTMGMNQFGDMTQHEFAAKLNGLRVEPVADDAELYTAPENFKAGSVNWVQKGAVTNVKDQGQCGSCWAFSTCAGIEGTVAVAGKPLVSLAPQELVDCDKADGNQGCNGGFMTRATTWAIHNGLCKWSDYRYTARDGSCKKSQCHATSEMVKSYKNVQRSKSAFESALSEKPLSIGVDAEPWQFYSGGIFSKRCGTSIDHGVLAAGYNSEYYLVKNSWGTSWGESGYIRVSNTANNECGILDSAIISSM
jgi:C1A family cysteine protease